MKVNCTLIVIFIIAILQYASGNNSNKGENDIKRELFSVLELPVGKIQGTLSEDKTVASYLGIRYGTYQKRFETSYMVDNLQVKDGEVYDATKFGDMCPQLNRLMQMMLFIHGGNYIQGSGNDPYIEGVEYAKKGIILVSINYRVGLFGFYAHPQLTKENPLSPSNFGLLDQIVALKWVKKYISFFGGNPDDVTVFGESAGANSIQWLMAHKDHATSPLFKNAILQSAPASAYPHELNEAETMGCENDTIECLRALHFDDLISFVWNRRTFLLTVTPLPYSPTRLASPHVDYVNFLSHPAEIGINDIIIGTTKHEWMLFIWVNHLLMKPSDEWMHNSLSLVFSSPHYLSSNFSNFSNLSATIEKLYPRENFESGLDRVSAVYTDMVFTCPSRSYAQKITEQGAKVFFYLFSHTAEYGEQTIKAYHASELPFVFQKRTPSFFGGLVKLFPTDFTQDEISLSDQMISLWSNLGDQDNLKLNNGTQWPQYTKDGDNLLELSVPVKILHHQFWDETCKFWDEIAPGPQKAIIFDLMEHEPFLLKLANEYFLNSIIFAVKQRKSIFLGFVSLFAVILIKKCFLGSPKKSGKEVKYPNTFNNNH